MSKANQIRSATAIFTMCVSIVGVVTTAVLSAKATPKATLLLEELKKEKSEPTTLEVAKKVAPVYAPAAIGGILTIASIVSTTILNRKNQAALTSAYALLNHNYHRYRDTVNKLFGEDADQKVMDDIILSERDDPDLFVCGLGGVESLDFNVPEEEHLFFDSYSERYFTATTSRVLQAEYHLNRNYILGGGVCVNEFYEFLGLDPIENGSDFGWDFEGGLSWLDFNHRTIELENRGNLPCCVIDFVFEPWKANEDYMSRR